MKSLKKLALVSVIAAAPLAANAQLKAMDDASMSSATGQSGLVIEASFGQATGNAALAGFTNIAYSATNGIAIDAFKWTVTGYSTDATGVMGASTAPIAGAFGGIIASGITIQGAATVDISATAGSSLGAGGDNGVAGSTGTGLGMIINGTMDIAVSDISTFAGSAAGFQQVDSFGAIEIDGLHLNNLGLVLHGYGK